MRQPKLTTRRSLTLSVVTLIACASIAQTRFNYQGVVRDANDTIVPNEPVNLRFTLHQDSETGLPVFTEEHNGLTTSPIGLVSVLIGGGTPGFGSLDSIPWSDHTYYLQVEVDIVASGFGFLEMGVSPIVSVPIAEYAKNGGKPWQYNPNGIHYNEGNVGVGTNLPTAPLEVKSFVKIVGDTLDSEHISLVAGDGTHDNHVSSYDEFGDRKWILNMLDRSDGNSIGFFSETTNLYNFRLMPTGRTQFRGEVGAKIQLFASGANDNWIESYDANDNRKWIINLYDESGSDHPFAIYSDDANGGSGQYLLYIRPDGRTQVRCLEILGGCRIIKKFNSTEALEPGTVVIADPDRPGEVRLTDKAYDTRVIGAISGANGIKPGLTLTQEGTSLDGAHPVALDGRIYVKVTGPVEVGDLLTTSAEPGKAMAVKNRKKAFGAVIGKALESDADGDGLVLMLVQPR